MKGEFLYYVGLMAFLSIGIAVGKSGLLDTKVRAKTDLFTAGLVSETIVIKPNKEISDRLPDMTCPANQRVVWLSAREIGCE